MRQPIQFGISSSDLRLLGLFNKKKISYLRWHGTSIFKFLKLFLFTQKAERDRQSTYLNATIWDWVGPTPGTKNSIQVSHIYGRDPTPWTITCCLLGYILAGSQNGKQSRVLNLDFSTWWGHLKCFNCYAQYPCWYLNFETKFQKQ